VKQFPNGMLTYHGYDAANQLSWTVNRKGDLTHLSSVYYEYDMDGLPAWQYRRDAWRGPRACLRLRRHGRGRLDWWRGSRDGEGERVQR